MNGVRLAVALCAVQSGAFAVAYAVLGSEQAGLAAGVRFTARTSFALFLPVYAASSLRRLCPHPLSRWLLRNRRYLGLSFAWALLLHGIAIGMLALLLGDAFVPDVVVEFAGGLAYALTAAMTLTSNDRAVRLLGPRRWGRLHRLGIHWLWIVFTFSWTGLALQAPAYWVLAGPAWAAAALRFTAWRRRLSRVAEPPRAAEPGLGEALGPIR